MVKSMPYVGAIAMTNTLEYGRAPFSAVVAEESGIVAQCVNYFANKCGLTLDREFEKNARLVWSLKFGTSLTTSSAPLTTHMKFVLWSRFLAA